ncbi:MAG TPA: hypothetical protein VF324_07180 [Methanobacterium sp.]
MLIITVLGFIIGIVGGILLFFVLGLLVFLLVYRYLVIFQARSVALTFESNRGYKDVD